MSYYIIVYRTYVRFFFLKLLVDCSNKFVIVFNERKKLSDSTLKHHVHKTYLYEHILIIFNNILILCKRDK